MSITINSTDKILIIAPHPDDEVIACGGFIAKYHNQIDILCVNSSGIKYEGDVLSAEEIAQIRCNEFYEVAKLAGVNKTYIEKLWGRFVMIDEMEKHYEDYMREFNVKDYNVILVPHEYDNHPEHRYVGNVLLKTMIEKQGCKEDLKILRYELWSPIQKPNYFEDITEYVNKKTELIHAYKSRIGSHYAERILALNKYRTLNSFFAHYEKFVEAYYAEDLKEYLKKPDIINKITDKDFKNEKFETFLDKQRAQEKINKLAKKYKNKRIVIYGAGEYTRCLFKNYDLSKLNVVAIADKRFEEDKVHEFYSLNCIKPEILKEFDCDAIFISNFKYTNIYDFLTEELLKCSKNKNIEIRPLIGKV